MIKTTQPALHGAQHLPDGSDPIPDLLTASFGDTNEGVILATLPGAYYKLDETSSDWADSSDAGRTLTHVSRTGELRGEPSEFDEGDGALCVYNEYGGSGEKHIGERTDSYFGFPGLLPFTASIRVKPREDISFSTPSSFGLFGTIDHDSGGWAFTAGPPGDLSTTNGHFRFRRRGVGGAIEQTTCEDAGTIIGGSWYRVTGTFDGTDMRLYIGSTLVDTDDASTVDLPVGTPRNRLVVGAAGVAEGLGGTYAGWLGWLDSVIIWNRALSGGEVADIAAGAEGTAQSGWVLTTDGAGGQFWAAPTVEVDY